MSDLDRGLGRRVPTDWRHVERHPVRTAGRPELVTAPQYVERILPIPRQYRLPYDQGTVGACVGFSCSWAMSILHRKRYDAMRLYTEAQRLDEWPETPPEEGSSVRAGYDVLRTVGHWRVWAQRTRPVELDEGIAANKWAITVDEVRASVQSGIPVVLGINWYAQFSAPEARPRLSAQAVPDAVSPFQAIARSDFWIGRDAATWGLVAGGHAICCVGASDTRQAVALCNTWGESYPFLVWLPYEALQRLLREDGEAGLITDRPKAV